MHEDYDTVDARIIVEHAGAIDLFGDVFGDRRRAVDRGQDADVVARAYGAARAPVAHKGSGVFFGQKHRGAGIDAIGVIAFELGEGAIAGVHVPARINIRGGEADGLVEFAHRFALGNGGRRHLVAGRDGIRRGQVFGRNLHTFGNRLKRHDHVVGGV